MYLYNDRRAPAPMSKAARGMFDMAEGTRNPTPDELATLNHPAVDPALRGAIFDARLRMGNMPMEDRYDYADTLGGLSAKIDRAIAVGGDDLAPLRRLISPASFGDSADDALSTISRDRATEGPVPGYPSDQPYGQKVAKAFMAGRVRRVARL